MCSPAASLASPSVTPGSGEARRMTATSGRICLSASTQSGPLGLWLRTLVESSRWSSRARFLEWRLRGLCSVRRTLFADTNCERPLPLNESAETLRRTDMPSSRCLYQLVPLEPRTDGTGCSLSEEEETMEMWPTPRTSEQGNNSNLEAASVANHKFPNLENVMARKLQAGLLPTPIARDGVGGAHPTDGDVRLTEGKTYQPFSASLKDLGAAMLLPTPLVVEREHPERVEALRATGATKINSRANGEQRPNGIVDFMNFYGMLPTPRAQEGGACTDIHYAHNRMERPSGCQATITDLAAHGMLPTPRSNVVNGCDLNNPKLAERNKSNLEEEVAKMVVSQEQDAGSTSRLSPLFTEEMMGFPFLWTTLPFLRPSGAPKPSKPTATP